VRLLMDGCVFTLAFLASWPRIVICLMNSSVQGPPNDGGRGEASITAVWQKGEGITERSQAVVAHQSGASDFLAYLLDFIGPW